MTPQMRRKQQAYAYNVWRFARAQHAPLRAGNVSAQVRQLNAVGMAGQAFSVVGGGGVAR